MGFCHVMRFGPERGNRTKTSSHGRTAFSFSPASVWCPQLITVSWETPARWKWPSPGLDSTKERYRLFCKETDIDHQLWGVHSCLDSPVRWSQDSTAADLITQEKETGVRDQHGGRPALHSPAAAPLYTVNPAPRSNFVRCCRTADPGSRLYSTYYQALRYKESLLKPIKLNVKWIIRRQSH